MDGSLGKMTRSASILAVMRSKDRIEELRKTLDGITAANLEGTVDSLDMVADSLKSDTVPHVLFVDIALDDPKQVGLLSKIIAAHEDEMAVIATAEHADLDGIRRLMRIGVADFVPQPLTAADIQNALESATSKLARADGSAGGRGKVISFIRSCGGVGATTVAVQTAMELASRGKSSRSVALIDFDLQYGDVALSLDIPERGGLPQILESPARLDEDFLHASLSTHGSGVQVLASPEDIVPLTALGPETATRILTIARGTHDYVVCDLPHAWTGWTGSVLRASDRIVLVTELSVSALQRSRRLLELMERQDLSHLPVTIVVNHVDTGWGWASRRKQAEEALGRPFDFIIREDRKTAREARDRGVPLREVRSGSSIIKDVRTLVDGLRGSTAPAKAVAEK